MKKLLCLLLLGAVVVLPACGNGKQEKPAEQTEQSAIPSEAPEQEEPAKI